MRATPIPTEHSMSLVLELVGTPPIYGEFCIACAKPWPCPDAGRPVAPTAVVIEVPQPPRHRATCPECGWRSADTNDIAAASLASRHICEDPRD